MTVGLVIVGLLAGTATELAACPADSRLTVRENLRLDRRQMMAEVPVPGRLPVDTAPPEEVGRWRPPRPWPVIAIHAALLPTGEVLTYSYPNDQSGGSPAVLWDVVADRFTDVSLDRDIFCTGLGLLADGTLLMTGGNAWGCSFQGTADVHRFDPFTRTWIRDPDMAVARWYPTNVLLPDGRVMITSGLDADCQLTPVMEIYTPGVGVEVVPTGARPLDLYPRQHLVGDGRVAHVGIEARSSIFDPRTERWKLLAPTRSGRRWAGTSVLVPGDPFSILIFGGGAPAKRSVERLDLRDAEPAWHDVAAMHRPRIHHNPVILPDGDILMVGGGAEGLYTDPIFHAERYDPKTDTWQLLPAQQHARMYHATALLLPDGRVLSAGQDHGESSFSAEIYEPAYLFRGARPEIIAAPASARYGTAFDVQVAADRAIERLVLVAPGAVTHGVDMTQRLVELDWQADGDTLHVQAPAHAALAPMGYYMLFALDDAGVPSVASWLRLELPTKPGFE